MKFSCSFVFDWTSYTLTKAFDMNSVSSFISSRIDETVRCDTMNLDFACMPSYLRGFTSLRMLLLRVWPQTWTVWSQTLGMAWLQNHGHITEMMKYAYILIWNISNDTLIYTFRWNLTEHIVWVAHTVSLFSNHDLPYCQTYSKVSPGTTGRLQTVCSLAF